MSVFNTVDFLLKGKATPGAWVDGYWIEGTNGPDIPFSGTKHPLEKRLETLPEGRRTKDNYLIITTTELNIAQPGTGVECSKIEVVATGEILEIFNILPWQNGIIPHYEYEATKLHPAEVET